MRKNFIALSALFGVLAVGLGAFGAHGLQNLLPPERIAIFRTGVDYHIYHTLALFGLGLLLRQRNSTLLQWAGNLFSIGILLFSGSLYLLACRDVMGIAHWSWLGPITPIGGTTFIIAWALIFLDQIKPQKSS